eukprot:CAMPEP_0172906202 /NCGR_PEP_ID=MMETSP1075-20121228/176329_1 /TAXON_ID=2916 /ORGANISM="Ceratium fusus, Strain PA161109" /LENGTH=60 /DNA_ID=CAMNT_0013763577 /DNA_START=29 /DNA_END=208 /DNA_ORIENTATION=+
MLREKLAGEVPVWQNLTDKTVVQVKDAIPTAQKRTFLKGCSLGCSAAADSSDPSRMLSCG